MESALAELGEHSLELEAIDARPIIHNCRKQLPQPRDVPLPAGQLEHGAAMGA